MDFSELGIKEIHEGLKKRSFSAKEISAFFIEKIKKKNKELFCFLEFNEDFAMAQASEVDKKIERKEEIALFSGVPIALKDNMMVRGMKCTSGSKMLENYKAPYTATVVEKLAEAGAVILGKTNMDEFAMGASTENSAFGITRNPLDLSRVPGGSSGGSSAAVAGGLCSFALGSDTGGSIRQPASFCGIVGLKPTYGTVSRHGIAAMASSLDQVGPMTKNVDDAEIVFSFISGRDKMDPVSANYIYSESEIDPKKLKIGIPKEYFVEGMDSQVKKTVEGAIVKAEKEGFKTKEISLPHTEYTLAAYYIITCSEVSANMARYDGIRYGFSERKGGNEESLSRVYFENRGKGLGTETKRRIILGNYMLSAGYYDAYYKKAQKARFLIENDFREAFKEVDLILTPTSPTLPFKVGEKIDNPLSMYLSDIFTAGVSLSGVPAISMPCGKVDKLSVGMQIIGRPFEENKIFKAGKYFEKIWK